MQDGPLWILREHFCKPPLDQYHCETKIYKFLMLGTQVFFFLISNIFNFTTPLLGVRGGGGGLPTVNVCNLKLQYCIVSSPKDQ
jgi:hypothetical protein